MARMTKEQRIEAERLREEARKEQRRQEYPGLVKEALTLATQANFEIEFKDENFVVRDRDDSRSEVFTFGFELVGCTGYMTVLNLISSADYKLSLMNERRRVEQLKTNALEKLTVEERKALGI